MATLAPLVIESGQQRQLVSADILLAQNIQAPLPGTLMAIGDNQSGAEIQIGNVGEDTRFLGNIIVDGGATVAMTTNLNGATVMTGNVSMGDNSGDVITIGGGSTDTVILLSDIQPGAGFSSLGQSEFQYFTEAWLASSEGAATVGPNLAAYNLKAVGVNAGGYAIGVNDALLTNIALPAGTTDLMSTLAAMDAAIGGAGATDTLNAVINAASPANTVNIPDTDEIVWADNGVSLTNPMFSLTRTATGAGDALKINMGAAATGRGILIEKSNVGLGSGMIIRNAVVPQNQTVFNPGAVSQEGGSNLSVGVLSGGSPSGNLLLHGGSNGAVAGGTATLQGGNTTGSGTGGTATVRGGTSTGSGAGGGVFVLGGDGTGAGGGSVSIVGGDAALPFPGGSGGAVDIDAGVGAASGITGRINIGTVRADYVAIGSAPSANNVGARVFHSSVTSGAGNSIVQLNDGRTQTPSGALAVAVGAYAIGVNAEALTNITLPSGDSDLQAALEGFNTALGSVSSTLDATMTAGSPDNVVSLTPSTAAEIWAVDDSGANGAGNEALLHLTRSATLDAQEYALRIDNTAAVAGANAGAGIGIVSNSGGIEMAVSSLTSDGVGISMTPGATSTGGNGISVQGNTNFFNGSNSLIFVGDSSQANEQLEFDHRYFTVTHNTAFTYAIGATTQPTLNTGGVAFSLISGNGNGTGSGAPLTLSAGDAGSLASASGGSVTLSAGDGAATGGDVTIQAGENFGATDLAQRGQIFINNSRLIEIGTAGVLSAGASPTSVAGSVVSGSPATVLSRAANILSFGNTAVGGRDTSGANDVGVGTESLTNTLAAGMTTEIDLQQVLEFMDTAIGTAAGGTSLSAAITTAPIANSVSVSAVDAANPLIFTDSVAAIANPVIEIVRSGAGAGAGLTITKSGAGTSPALSIDGTGGSVGALVSVLNASGAGAFSVSSAGDTGMGEDSATTARFSTDAGGGTALVTAADDKALTFTAPSGTAGTNNELRLDSGATYGASIESFKTDVSNTLRFGDANIDLISTALGTETALDITIRADAAAIGASSGNVLIGATNSVAGGTKGGIVLTTEDSTFAAAAPGTVLIDSVDVVTQASADVTFDALGMTTPITVNEAGDLDLSGFTATSIVGALNELKATAVGGAVSYTAVIESGVTIAVGDCIAASTVTGRITQMNANANANGAFIGIATTAGTGDAGGTVSATITVAGAVNNQSGLTAGSTCFAPDGTGVATTTAPANVGDLVFRVGFAISATVMVLSAGEGVIL